MNGRLLEKWRDYLGLTQDKLAEKAGVGVNTIIRYEAGAEGTDKIWRRLFETFNITPSEFLAGPPSRGDAREPSTATGEWKGECDVPETTVRGRLVEMACCLHGKDLTALFEHAELLYQKSQSQKICPKFHKITTLRLSKGGGP